MKIARAARVGALHARLPIAIPKHGCDQFKLINGPKGVKQIFALGLTMNRRLVENLWKLWTARGQWLYLYMRASGQLGSVGVVSTPALPFIWMHVA